MSINMKSWTLLGVVHHPVLFILEWKLLLCLLSATFSSLFVFIEQCCWSGGRTRNSILINVISMPFIYLVFNIRKIFVICCVLVCAICLRTTTYLCKAKPTQWSVLGIPRIHITVWGNRWFHYVFSHSTQKYNDHASRWIAIIAITISTRVKLRVFKIANHSFIQNQKFIDFIMQWPGRTHRIATLVVMLFEKCGNQSVDMNQLWDGIIVRREGEVHGPNAHMHMALATVLAKRFAVSFDIRGSHRTRVIVCGQLYSWTALMVAEQPTHQQTKEKRRRRWQQHKCHSTGCWYINAQINEAITHACIMNASLCRLPTLHISLLLLLLIINSHMLCLLRLSLSLSLFVYSFFSFSFQCFISLFIPAL